MFYRKYETRNKADIIKFIIEKRLPAVSDNIYFESIYKFYTKKTKRSIVIENIPDDIPLYYGKDVRNFNKKLLNNTIDKFYLNFMNEMKNGFEKVIVSNKNNYDKMKIIARFMCIDNVNIEMKG